MRTYEQTKEGQMLKPTAIIGQFMNEERTRGFMLQVDGTLVEITRENTWDMWSPPEDVAVLTDTYEGFRGFLRGLTEPQPEAQPLTVGEVEAMFAAKDEARAQREANEQQGR